MGKHRNTTFDHARDELFSHIHRCDVLKANAEQQNDWLRETVEYLGETFPALTDRELNELRDIGQRFCQPPIPHGKSNTELTRDEWEDSGAEEEAGTAAVAA